MARDGVDNVTHLPFPGFGPLQRIGGALRLSHLSPDFGVLVGKRALEGVGLRQGSVTGQHSWRTPEFGPTYKGKVKRRV